MNEFSIRNLIQMLLKKQKNLIVCRCRAVSYIKTAPNSGLFIFKRRRLKIKDPGYKVDTIIIILPLEFDFTSK